MGWRWVVAEREKKKMEKERGGRKEGGNTVMGMKKKGRKNLEG